MTVGALKDAIVSCNLPIQLLPDPLKVGSIMVLFRFHSGLVTMMPTITLKGLPDALYERLKQQAEANRRSLNSEVIVCLEQAVNLAAANSVATLARLDALRDRISPPLLTDPELTLAKNSGRA